MKKKIALILVIVIALSCMSLTTLAVGRNHYDVYVSKATCKVHIYYNDQWIKVMTCDIGKPSTPTPSGVFYTGNKGFSFGMDHGYLCKNATQFSGNYLFHSVIYSADGKTITDGRLGMAISHGCIRLDNRDAKWLVDNLPRGTMVKIR